MTNPLYPVRNRSALTGRLLPGLTLRNSDGAWVGPGLGDFRSIREAREWVAKQPAWHGYQIAA